VGVNSVVMKEQERQASYRFWLLRTAAVLFSTVSAFGFLGWLAEDHSLDYLLDKPPRNFATYWLILSLCCFIGAISTIVPALPRWASVSRLSRFGHVVVAAILSTVVTVLIGLLLFFIISAFSSGTVY